MTFARPTLLTGALLLVLTLPALADSPGFADLTIPAPHHDRELEAGIWYPAPPRRHVYTDR